MVEIEIVFQDGEVVTISNVLVEETPFAITVFRDPDRKNVVPLANNVKQYQITELF